MEFLIGCVVAMFVVAAVSGIVVGVMKEEYVKKNEIDYARITTSEPNEYSTYEVHYKNGTVKLYRAHRTSNIAKMLMPHLK